MLKVEKRCENVLLARKCKNNWSSFRGMGMGGEELYLSSCQKQVLASSEKMGHFGNRGIAENKI